MPYADPEKQREYQRRWIAKRRAEYMDGKTCKKCGTAGDLHIHHRDTDTKVHHRIWSWARPRLEAELAKCDILCGECHRESHPHSVRSKHGTVNRYLKYGCRCPACREAKAEYRASRSHLPPRSR